MNGEATAKFKALLRELFQFDCADLDFGIYRIMNQKRDAVERFIEQDLVAGVHAALAGGALGEQAETAKELCEVRKATAEKLGEDALAADGSLAETCHNTPLGRRYVTLQKKVGHGPASADWETCGNWLIERSFFSEPEPKKRAAVQPGTPGLTEPKAPAAEK